VAEQLIRKQPQALSDNTQHETLIAGLRERGYIEGRNIVLEHRFSAEMPERFRSMAAELAALKPDLRVSPPSALALKNAGTSMPIILVTPSRSDY
jgi:hypothetical protein